MALEAELKAEQARRDELESVLEAAGAGAGAGEQPAASAVKKRASGKSEFGQMMNNMANGFVTVTVYFADIVSDVQVVVLLWKTKNFAWAWMSIFFLIAQFVAICARARPPSYHIRTASAAALPQSRPLSPSLSPIALPLSR